MLEFNYKEMPQSLMGHPVIVKQSVRNDDGNYIKDRDGEILTEYLQRINMYRIVGIQEEPIPMYLHELIQHGYVIVDIKETGVILLHKGVDIGGTTPAIITIRDILKEEEQSIRGGHSSASQEKKEEDPVSWRQ